MSTTYRSGLPHQEKEAGIAFRTGAIDAYRFALLQMSPTSSLQDRWDIAHAALTRHDQLGAFLMLAGVGLELGFSAPALEWWRRTGNGTGLWTVAWSSQPQNPGGFVVDRALTELQRLVAVLMSSPSEDDEATNVPPPPNGVVSLAVARDCAHDLAAALAAFLASSEPNCALLLWSVRASVGRLAPIDVRHHVGVPDHELTLLVALEQLRRRFEVMAEFLRPPLGSPALLQAVAGVEALGPWLDNLPRLARSGKDLLTWPWGAGYRTLSSTDLSHWCVLTATSARASQWKQLADQFGVHRMGDALRAMLARMARLPVPDDDGYVVNHLRDVCLAEGFPLLAAEAQRMVVARHPNDTNEQLILADTLALLDLPEEASSLLARLSASDPDNEDVKRRMAAMRARTLQAFIVSHGFFGDPEHGVKRRRGFGLG